ncbi:hypothetical protein SAMN05216241_10124 [Limimonas halophila]|uniref:Uncharacterized protein n=1 Tax=Limimonas halophila TaxID=1082479 RepID=A0A1G7KWZ8_9PROT|nr:hypothetical protein [Limimonas halophila]SDF41616.1 hypothetical protein SAMN05216241_10124 [Limimonas halophila]
MWGRRPVSIPLLRLAGTLSAVAAAILLVAAVAVFTGGSVGWGAAGVPLGIVFVAAAVVVAFAAAMLFGFATNLDLLHAIREQLRGRRF